MLAPAAGKQPDKRIEQREHESANGNDDRVRNGLVAGAFFHDRHAGIEGEKRVDRCEQPDAASQGREQMKDAGNPSRSRMPIWL